MSNKTPKIYVAGHRGIVGSAIIRELAKQGQANVVRDAFSKALINYCL